MSALHASAAKKASAKAAPPVMRKSAPPPRHAAAPLASLAAIPAMVQRQCANCEQEEEAKESAIRRRLAATAAAPLPQRACAACDGEEKEESAIQPRLEVGPVGDHYEQEADSIAERVMAMRDPGMDGAAADASGADGVVQRACGACSSSRDEPRARRMADAEEEVEGHVVRARRDGGDETIAASDGELTRGGSALPAATRSFFESRMGRDLGDVRVHSGADALAKNASISARAFTYKNHVWLGAGESASPTFTMAHELAHVMQQTAPGPVGPQRRAASDADVAVQRTPFFMQSGKQAPSHATMHKVAQDNIRKHNTDLLTEVPIPGANRKVVALGKCGFADFYTANLAGGLIPVPGVESVETAPGSGVTKLQDLTALVSKSSCVGTASFDTIKRGDADYPHDTARAPTVDAAGVVDKIDSAPTGIKVGELKPAHDVNYRGSGVTQLDNYIAGINQAKLEANAALTRQGSAKSWDPAPAKWTNISLPPGWDAAGQDASSTWPVPDLMVRDYQKAPAPPPGPKTKKAKGAPAATAKDVQSGSGVKISGRWMLAKDSTRIPGGDGVYVYFLAPNPDQLTRALKSRKTTAEFRKLSKKVRAVYQPLLATPDVKKSARRQPLPARPPDERGGDSAPALPAVRARAKPRVQRKATDPFDRKQWELMRTGSFEGETKSGSLAELFATTPSEQHREQAAELNGIAEWVRNPPETANGVTYSTEGAKESDPASDDFDTLRKAAFWSGPLAAPIGLLRERFGQMFIKGHAAFMKVKKKIRDVFKNARFSAGGSSGIGAAAAKVVGKIFVQLGKVVLARTADIIAQCMQSGFAAFMRAQVDGSIDELMKKAEEAQIAADKLKEDVEEKIRAALDAVIGDYEARIKLIADDAKMIAAIGSAVSEVVRIARLGFCVAGLGAAGWGAIVTCALSVGDWIASKYDMSPLDAVIKRVMNSCEGRWLFAKALLEFQEIRSLPTLLAQTILKPIKDMLPPPADQMLCDIDALKVEDLDIKDFDCKGGDGDSEGEGDSASGGDPDEESESGGGPGAGGPGSGESEGPSAAGPEGPGGDGPSGPATEPPAGGPGSAGSEPQDGASGSPEPKDSKKEGHIEGGEPNKIFLQIHGGFDPKAKHDGTKSTGAYLVGVQSDGTVYGPLIVDIYVHELIMTGSPWRIRYKLRLADPTQNLILIDGKTGKQFEIAESSTKIFNSKWLPPASMPQPAKPAAEEPEQ